MCSERLSPQAHRLSQRSFHPYCLIFSGPPAPASAFCFLCELYGASPPHVSEKYYPLTKRKHSGDQPFIQTTGDDAAMRQHQSDDPTECQREGTFFRRPSPGRSRINQVNGSTRGLRSVSMTRKRSLWQQLWGRYYVVTSASLRCSICFLTFIGKACSASRSS